MCAAGLMHEGSFLLRLQRLQGQVRQGFPRPYRMSLQDIGRAHNLPQDRRRDSQYKEKGSNSNPSYPQPEGH